MNKHHVLKQTHVGEVMVSTISLIALDLEFEELMGHPFPAMRGGADFETMVFGPGDHSEQYRYSTAEEALEHHDQLVEQLKLLEGGKSGSS